MKKLDSEISQLNNGIKENNKQMNVYQMALDHERIIYNTRLDELK